MKLLSLAVAIGLAAALSVGAQQPQQQQQTTTDEQQQLPTQKGAKAKVEQTTGAQENVSAGAKVSEKGKVEKGKVKEGKAGVSAKESGKVSHSTTVFRNGKQTSEHLSLHRSFRERTDAHFSIGFHERVWWIRTYTIVLIDGCHYYLADNGCWYPAYGFDPACDYPVSVVYCD